MSIQKSTNKLNLVFDLGLRMHFFLKNHYILRIYTRYYLRSVVVVAAAVVVVVVIDRNMKPLSFPISVQFTFRNKFYQQKDTIIIVVVDRQMKSISFSKSVQFTFRNRFLPTKRYHVVALRILTCLRSLVFL